MDDKYHYIRRNLNYCPIIYQALLDGGILLLDHYKSFCVAHDSFSLGLTLIALFEEDTDLNMVETLSPFPIIRLTSKTPVEYQTIIKDLMTPLYNLCEPYITQANQAITIATKLLSISKLDDKISIEHLAADILCMLLDFSTLRFSPIYNDDQLDGYFIKRRDDTFKLILQKKIDFKPTIYGEFNILCYLQNEFDGLYKPNMKKIAVDAIMESKNYKYLFKNIIMSLHRFHEETECAYIVIHETQLFWSESFYVFKSDYIFSRNMVRIIMKNARCHTYSGYSFLPQYPKDLRDLFPTFLHETMDDGDLTVDEYFKICVINDQYQLGLMLYRIITTQETTQTFPPLSEIKDKSLRELIAPLFASMKHLYDD